MSATLRVRYLASAAMALVGSVVVSALLGLLCNLIAVDAINVYGTTLFFFAPALMGFAGSILFARWNGSITILQSLGVTLLALLLAASVLLLVNWEGLICLAMAAPIALVAGAIGGAVGTSLASRGTKNLPSGTALLVLIFPIVAWGEGRLQPAAPASVVTTSIVLPATPAEIWPHLQNFTIEAEPAFIGFRAGIAYPLATRTIGTGVGAARACILSTGTMAERITAWNPPHLLAFDVLSTPPPMFEMSPFREIHPPHLHDTYVSKRGEFRLEALVDGSTRLIGTSWYEQRLWPGWYWLAYSDAVVRAVHARVYEQIRVNLEKDRERRSLAQR
jgi:hypothetical protein